MGWNESDPTLSTWCEEELAIDQAINTDSPVSAPSRPDLAAPEEYSNKINVETAPPEIVEEHKVNVESKIQEATGGEEIPTGVNIAEVEQD